tara:strand:+ start:292 stop:711 length:420 start_codon:yes stop_codon:yes gene_type:complete
MAGQLTMPTDAVTAELRHWAREPFALGTGNCGLSVLGYAERVREATVRRGRGLVGRRSAARLMRSPERFVLVAAALMARLGCPETDAPLRGDVGLIDLPAGLTAAICLGDGDWAARGPRSTVIGPATAEIAWSVRCPQR